MTDKQYQSSLPANSSPLGAQAIISFLYYLQQQTGDSLLTFNSKIGTGLLCLLSLI